MLAMFIGAAFLLGLIIFIHELGHYVCGRLVGVRAEIFSIGYGRGIWKKKIGDTTWQITAIPLGGYVKFYGDDMEDPDKTPGGFYATHPLKRIIPILGGPLFNLLLGFLVFMILHAMSGPPAPVIHIDEYMGERSPAYIGGLRNGDRVLAINDEAVHDYSDMVKHVLISEGRDLVFRVDRGGETIERTVTPHVTPSGATRVHIRFPGDQRIEVNYPNVEVWKYEIARIFSDPKPEGAIRAMPYLKDGDIILRVEGNEIRSVPDLQGVLGSHHGETVSITVERESYPWIAPFFTHVTTVEVPSRPEYDVVFHDLVDQKYDEALPVLMLKSIVPEHQKVLDELIVNDQPARSFPDLAPRFADPQDARVRIGDATYTATVQVKKTGTLGFMPAAIVDGMYLENHEGFFAVLSSAAADTYKNVMLYPLFFKNIFTGRISLIDSAAGPVRIFAIAGSTIKGGPRNYLTLFAMISIALFVMNLIPFPIVDGGHIVFCIYEAIAGKMPSARVMEGIYRVAFSILLLFGLVIMYRDVLWTVNQ